VDISKDFAEHLDVALEEIGAQNLAGSGFESEIPDAEFAASQEAIEDGGRH
jgi:hypothetical protein